MTGTMRSASRSAVKITTTVSDNAAQNRAAVKAMDPIERECGITRSELAEFHAAERARVRARWGLA
jgi:hypothetical protein